MRKTKEFESTLTRLNIDNEFEYTNSKGETKQYYLGTCTLPNGKERTINIPSKIALSIDEDNFPIDITARVEVTDRGVIINMVPTLAKQATLEDLEEQGWNVDEFEESDYNAVADRHNLQEVSDV